MVLSGLILDSIAAHLPSQDAGFSLLHEKIVQCFDEQCQYGGPLLGRDDAQLGHDFGREVTADQVGGASGSLCLRFRLAL